MTDAKFQIRMPPDLHQKLSEAASFSRRSMNAEIVERLHMSFEAPSVDSRLKALEAQVEILMKKAK